MARRNFHVCSIIPPHTLENVAKNSKDPAERNAAEKTLAMTARLQGQRDVLAMLGQTEVPAGEKYRAVYDARHTERLPGFMRAREGDGPTGDPGVDEAYSGAGLTFDLYAAVFQRIGLDGRGMRMLSTAHYGRRYNNAFWNGRQMVYGDGDGRLFGRFTSALDVCAHELTHGLTQYTTNLVYGDQPGALNEHFSDVMGTLVKQWSKQQSADVADWLIGEGLFMRQVNARGIRSMKEPGTAYDDPALGKDPQPGHMNNYVNTDDDNGGVHINSGIPNKAFYLAASRIGGNAWERAGRIWFDAFTARLWATAGFGQAAAACVAAAETLFGAGSAEAVAVRSAWNDVGVSF